MHYGFLQKPHKGLQSLMFAQGYSYKKHKNGDRSQSLSNLRGEGVDRISSRGSHKNEYHLLHTPDLEIHTTQSTSELDQVSFDCHSPNVDLNKNPVNSDGEITRCHYCQSI